MPASPLVPVKNSHLSVNRGGEQEATDGPAGSRRSVWNPLDSVAATLASGVVLTGLLTLALMWWMGA